MNEKRAARENLVEEVIEKLNERMKDAQVDAEIYGRPKHIYSIYRKMHDKKSVLMKFMTLLPFAV